MCIRIESPLFLYWLIYADVALAEFRHHEGDGGGGEEILCLIKLRVMKMDCESDVWLTVHRNSVWIRKTN